MMSYTWTLRQRTDSRDEQGDFLWQNCPEFQDGLVCREKRAVKLASAILDTHPERFYSLVGRRKPSGLNPSHTLMFCVSNKFRNKLDS